MMAHALFVRNGNVFVFVVNLKRLWDAETRVDETRELCRWMQLVHALVEKPASARPIIVGTHKDGCDDIAEMWRILNEGLKNEVGEAVYDTWVRVGSGSEGGELGMQFVAVENSRALENPSSSGLSELEEIVKRAADSIVAARQEVPARWVAFVEELERSTLPCLNKSDIAREVEGFPAFSLDRKERGMDALEALRYFSGLGRLVLFEMSKDEVFVFPRPAIILDFVRQVTGPEELARRRLGQEHAKMLDRGLLTCAGLKALWHGYSDEIRRVMLDVLCRFDLLMRLPPEHGKEGRGGELIAVPVLLPKAGKGLRCPRKAGESEIRVQTRFTDAFPPGLIGSLISHLHKEIGGGRTRAGFLGSDAAVLTSRVELKGRGRVMVALVSEQRRIEWKVVARSPVRVMRSCLKALEDFMKCPLRGMQMSRTHLLTTRCRSELEGCGGEWSVEFALPGEWICDSSCRVLPNVEGECASSCEEVWTLSELLPEMVKTKNPVTARGNSEAVDVRDATKPFDVFISHAGPDKLYIARPLYKELSEKGMNCFLDKVGLEPGDCGPDRMTAAMETADIGVFILSPEFVARRWTMRELRCFLRRRQACSPSRDMSPVVIPVFYRLSIAECRNLELEKYKMDDRGNLFVVEGFHHEDRQEEAPTAVVREAMKAVTEYTGIENTERASNDMADPFAPHAQAALVKRITMWVTQKYEELNRQRRHTGGVDNPS